MRGRGLSSRYEPGPQSGGRPPAPGRLGLVQAFVNTHFDLEHERGADLLATPSGLEAWLDGRDLGGRPVTRAAHGRALVVREGLRAVLSGHNGMPADRSAVEALSRLSGDLPAGVHVDAAGITAPAPVQPGGDGALGLVLAVAHEAQAAGTWRRLKVCPGPHCGWAFYDHSRNASGTWCSMQVCGGRVKARAYRSRSRG